MTTRFRRTGRAALTTLMLTAACAASLAADSTVSEEDVRRYNHVPLSRQAQVADNTDNGDIAGFRGYRFNCRKQQDYSKPESAQAKAALDRFMAYFVAHPSPSDRQKTERLALLQAAIKAGSWRADYIDVMWGIWAYRGSPQELRTYADRLQKMAADGVPIAIHSFLRWTDGQYENPTRRIQLLKAALERGNPNTMSSVGYELGTHTLELRPMAKRMLDCASAQGDPDAFNGIGRIAWQEGRWIDAYRTWVHGANLGCEACLEAIEELVVLRPGHDVEGGTDDVDPGFKALRAFYANQFIYQITQLTDLRMPAPAALQVTVSDASIVQLIKSRLARYGTP